MTPVDAPGNSREPVLALTDIVLATGPVGEEKLILRGLDLRLEEDQTVCIVFDNVDQAEALANVISGRQVVTHGRIYRAHGDPVSVIWANDDKIKETPPAGIVLSAVPPRDRSVFSKVFVLEAGRLRVSEDVGWEMVTPERLEVAVAACLSDHGLASTTADLVARVLVDANRRGHSSHGVGLLPTYLERIKQGGIKLCATPSWDWQTDTMASLNCDGAIGQLGADQAAEWVARQARTEGIAVVAIRNNNHVGMMAAYRNAFQRNGVMGLLTNISGTSVTPPDGDRLSLGSNALCLVTPLKQATEPFCIDMASGVVAAGKIRDAAAFGRSIPSGWLLDADGQPTEDPKCLDDGGMIPVFGGYKGLGIHLILELLAGVLAAGMTSGRVHKQRKELGAPMECSQLFMAINPSKFGREELDHYIAELMEMVADGYGNRTPPDIQFPDEQEARATAAANAKGISISPEVQNCIGGFLSEIVHDRATQ